MDSHPALVILVSVIFSAFFSGIEIAFVSANKMELEVDKSQGMLPAFFYRPFQTADRFITAMLLGNNISLVIYGLAFGNLFMALVGDSISNSIAQLLIQTIFSTLIILFTAEFLPKALFSINPNRALRVFALPVTITYYILFPLVIIVNSISKGVLKYIMGVEYEEKKLSFSIVDLENYVTESGNSSREDEAEQEKELKVQIFKNALQFRDAKARECMVPRTEIVAVELNTDVNELRHTFVDTGLSKILVYKENIDNIIGYVHSSELFKKPEFIKSILLPISIVPETMPANEVLELLIAQKRSIAVVVDEFGGTSGMLTIEDVVEEIFGEIEDEHDNDEMIETKLSKDTYLFSARQEVDYINEEYKLNLPESEDYETIAGLIFHVHESIPEQGEEIEYSDFKFVIEKVSQKRIELVKLILKSAN